MDRGPRAPSLPPLELVAGQTIDMWCYYNNADEVELFINGRSQGIRKKTPHQYHVSWRVVFEPGEVKAVARRNGQTVGEQVIATAGAPSRIRLTTDYSGKDLTFIAVEITDDEGRLCPLAENQVFFTSPELQIVGVDNGCQTSMERFKDNKRKAFFGKCLVVVKGKGTLTARAVGLQQAAINVE